MTKNIEQILSKMKIEKLNPMQEAAFETITNSSDVILHSPTGSGKTLAFLLPIIQQIDPMLAQVQVLILVPSRELALQIEQVTRSMGAGLKVNAIYGGRSDYKDSIDLKHPPAILVGTPGRIADHFFRKSFSLEHIQTLVLDEFDKSLEVGFKNDMMDICGELYGLKRRVLTSATKGVSIPEFVGLRDPKKLDFTDVTNGALKLRTIDVDDMLEGLVESLLCLQGQSGIVFCNFKDAIKIVSAALEKRQIPHGCFYGGMEQSDREMSLIKFRNGTHRLIIATDLAARGLDIPEINFIIHYQLPPRVEEFIHRNGRTARMHQDGTAYILNSSNARKPLYLEPTESVKLDQYDGEKADPKATLLIAGGRKDKISKGDIAGLFMKQGELTKDELGVIELKTEIAYVSVPKGKVHHLASTLNNSRLKKKKVRIFVV